MAVYPNSIFPWNNRIDNQNIVYANDPNSLAAEIVAIERTLGTTPNVEHAIGPSAPITYSTVDNRIAAAAAGENLPYCLLHQPAPREMAAGTASMETFTAEVTDFYGMWNGADITMPYTGMVLMRANVQWDALGAKPQGRVGQQLILTNKNFPNANTPGLLPGSGELGTDWRHFDSSHEGTVYGLRGYIIWTGFVWLGVAHAGDRISLKVYNATDSKIRLNYGTLRCVVLRQITQPFPWIAN